MPKKVWVTLGRTESGDDVGPFVWATEPDSTRVLELLMDTYPEEYEYVGGVTYDTVEAELYEYE